MVQKYWEIFKISVHPWPHPIGQPRNIYSVTLPSQLNKLRLAWRRCHFELSPALTYSWPLAVSGSSSSYPSVLPSYIRAILSINTGCSEVSYFSIEWLTKIGICSNRRGAPLRKRSNQMGRPLRLGSSREMSSSSGYCLCEVGTSVLLVWLRQFIHLAVVFAVADWATEGELPRLCCYFRSHLLGENLHSKRRRAPLARAWDRSLWLSATPEGPRRIVERYERPLITCEKVGHPSKRRTFSY